MALCWISVYAIKLPEHAVRKRSVISYRNWSEVSTEEFAGFLSQERRLTKEEKIENEIKPELFTTLPRMWLKAT